MQRVAKQVAQPQAASVPSNRFVRLAPEEYEALLHAKLEERLGNRRLCLQIRRELSDQGRLYLRKEGYEWVGLLSAGVCEAVIALLAQPASD